MPGGTRLGFSGRHLPFVGAVATAGLKPNPANSKHLINESLNPPQAHVDHMHLELNWPGARKRTSFWRSPLG